MKNEENRMSFFTVAMIIVVLVVMLLVLKFYVFDNFLKEDTKNVDEKAEVVDGVTDIEGEDYIKIEDGVKINISQNLEEEKELDGFIFSDFYIYSVDGATRIEFDVENMLETREVLDDFKINVYTEKGKVGRFSCKGDSFAAKQTKRLSVTVNADIANLYDIELEKIYSQEF